MLRSCGLDETADGEDCDVVLLAEFFGGVGDEEGGLIAEIADAVEAEKLAVGFASFGDAVRHHEETVAGVQVEADFFIFDTGNYAQGQAAGKLDFLAVEVGWRVARAGDDHFAVGVEVGDLAGGEAGTAESRLQRCAKISSCHALRRDIRR